MTHPRNLLPKVEGEEIRAFSEGSWKAHLYLPDRDGRSVCGKQTLTHRTYDDLEPVDGPLSDNPELCELCEGWYRYQTSNHDENTDDLAERVEVLEAQVELLAHELDESRALIEQLVGVLQDMNDDQHDLADRLQDMSEAEPIADRDPDLQAFR